MKVFERLAQAFRAEGVSATFGMMGDANMLWLSEMHRLGVRVHEVRHEGAGLGMADGWGRVTGEPGVATTTCGPGVTQLATALVTAARANSPVVAFCGEHPISDDEYHQRLDQARFAEACETGFVRLGTAQDADEAVRKAFHLARSESRPVMLSVPLDLQNALFEDGDEPYVPSSVLMPQWPAQADPRAIAAAADLLAASRRPVIVVGRGALQAEAGDAVRRLAERTGALIATTLLAKTWLNDDPFHAGISGNYAFRTAIRLFHEADCVIGVGASLNRNTTENGYLYPAAKYLQIDRKPGVVRSGVKGVDCFVQGDARATVEALEQALAARSFRQAGFRTPEVRAQLAQQAVDAREYPLDPGTVDPRQACLLMDELLPAQIGVFSGTGMVANISNMTMRRQRAITLATHAFGCIGQMMPAAMGAIAARGNQPLVLLNGDASTLMHLGEFETAVRYGMPLLIVVMNNEALGPEYYSLANKQRDPSRALVSTPDLGQVAVSLGGRGALVRSLDELRAALQSWLAAPGPMMIDLRVSRTVVPIPYRRTYFGADD